MADHAFTLSSLCDLLGSPRIDQTQSWGIERRYLIARDHLARFRQPIFEAIRRHHNTLSQIVIEELIQLGFAQTALEIERLRSGLPFDSVTQAAHFVEVLGAEYAHWLLGFDTTQVYPKQFNPNINQAMKGPDIVGVRSDSQPALLFGEAKWRSRYEAAALNEAYQSLNRLIHADAARTLYLWRNVTRQTGQARTFDKALSVDAKRAALIVYVTGDPPPQKFLAIADACASAPIPNLIFVYIEIPQMGLSDFGQYFTAP